MNGHHWIIKQFFIICVVVNSTVNSYQRNWVRSLTSAVCFYPGTVLVVYLALSSIWYRVWESLMSWHFIGTVCLQTPLEWRHTRNVHYNNLLDIAFSNPMMITFDFNNFPFQMSSNYMILFSRQGRSWVSDSGGVQLCGSWTTAKGENNCLCVLFEFKLSLNSRHIWLLRC